MKRSHNQLHFVRAAREINRETESNADSSQRGKGINKNAIENTRTTVIPTTYIENARICCGHGREGRGRETDYSMGHRYRQTAQTRARA